MKKLTFCFIIFGGFQTAFSQWSNNTAINTAVCTEVGFQHDVRVIPDGKGGAIAAWLDNRTDATSDTTDADIFVQRLDKDGYIKYFLDGVGICINNFDQPSVNIVTDGASGAIIIWRTTQNGNNDIYVQKIDSVGNIKWAAGGVPVCNDTNNQKGAKAVSDGAGGAIVSYEYKINGSGNWDIYAQRLDANGNRLWAPTSSGKNLSVLNDDENDPRIETDGSGGAIVVWTRYSKTPVDYDIIAQKVNSSGTGVWPTGGVYVCNDAALQVQPKIEPDGSGGAIIVWMDSVGTTVADIYAQRISSSNGAKLWNGGNKVAVCTDITYQGAHDVASEGINGAVIAWKDYRGGNKDVYAQKLDLANGASQWLPVNGIPIVNGLSNEGNPNLWGDGAGNVLCVWQDTMGFGGDVYAQKIDANGNLLWAVGGAPLATAAKNQTLPKHVPDGAGGLICFFQDNRDSATTNYDIYAQRLLSDGTLPDGVFNQEMLVESKCYPNPFTEHTTIQVSGNNKYQVSGIKIYDVFGREVNPSASRTLNGFVIQRGGLLQGNYFYRIFSDNKPITSGCFIIIN